MAQPTSRRPFAVRDFRLLWTGEAVSTLGDQFALIALPWLALVLTGSGLALGSRRARPPEAASAPGSVSGSQRCR